jgi:rSAM/selenodomain-associated transferase 2
MPIRLSVVIPTLDAARTLPHALEAMVAPFVEVIVADGGSRDGTAEVARQHGATLLTAPRGRGPQLAAGARVAAADWLMFLHADSAPGIGWGKEVGAFMADPANRERAGYFRFALDDDSEAAKRLERAVAWRCRRLGLPYGDQGLVIGRAFYEALGGYRPLALMEDIDLARRIGRSRLVPFETAAVTSAARYRRGGYVRRPLRNLACLGLYFAGVPPRMIARLYG